MTTAPKNYLEEEQRTTALGYVPGCQRRLSNASKMAHVSSSCVSDRQKSTRAPAAASPRPRALPRDGGRCAALRRAACGRARRPPLQPTPPPKKEGEKCGRFHGGSKRRRLAPLRGAPRAQYAPYSQPPRRSASCKHEGRRAHSRPCSREHQCTPLRLLGARARFSVCVSGHMCRRQVTRRTDTALPSSRRIRRVFARSRKKSPRYGGALPVALGAPGAPGAPGALGARARGAMRGAVGAVRRRAGVGARAAWPQRHDPCRRHEGRSHFLLVLPAARARRRRRRRLAHAHAAGSVDDGRAGLLERAGTLQGGSRAGEPRDTSWLPAG